MDLQPTLKKIDSSLASVPLPVYGIAIAVMMLVVGTMVYDRVNYQPLPNLTISNEESYYSQVEQGLLFQPLVINITTKHEEVYSKIIP